MTGTDKRVFQLITADGVSIERLGEAAAAFLIRIG